MQLKIKNKTHYADGFSVNAYLKAGEFLRDPDGKTVELEGGWIKEIINFLAKDVFNDAFTPEEFLEGYKSHTIAEDIIRMLCSVRGTVEEELAKFPTIAAGGGEEKNAKGSLPIV